MPSRSPLLRSQKTGSAEGERSLQSSCQVPSQMVARGGGDGEFRWPMCPVIDGDGNVYVSECSNDRIQVFDSHGRFLRKWGSEGSRDGEFIRPQELAIDGAGNIYVSDRDNHRIQVFDPQGRFLRKWGVTGSGDGEFRWPQGLGIDLSLIHI